MLLLLLRLYDLFRSLCEISLSEPGFSLLEIFKQVLSQGYLQVQWGYFLLHLAWLLFACPGAYVLLALQFTAKLINLALESLPPVFKKRGFLFQRVPLVPELIHLPLECNFELLLLLSKYDLELVLLLLQLQPLHSLQAAHITLGRNTFVSLVPVLVLDCLICRDDPVVVFFQLFVHVLKGLDSLLQLDLFEGWLLLPFLKLSLLKSKPVTQVPGLVLQGETCIYKLFLLLLVFLTPVPKLTLRLLSDIRNLLSKPGYLRVLLIQFDVGFLKLPLQEHNAILIFS